MKTLGNNCWSLEDEREEEIPTASIASLLLDLDEVVSVSSTNNCLVLQGSCVSTVVTGTLKSASVEQARFLVVDSKFFEWTRGAAASG